MAYKDPSDPRLLEKRREHYRNNKEAYKARSKKLKQEMRDWLNKEKDVPCMDCGCSYPYYVMDLDHRDPTNKVAEIGILVNRGSWSKLKAERNKCDIICANCHRERTHGTPAIFKE